MKEEHTKLSFKCRIGWHNWGKCNHEKWTTTDWFYGTKSPVIREVSYCVDCNKIKINWVSS